MALVPLTFVIPLSAAMGAEGERRRRSAMRLITGLGIVALLAVATGGLGAFEDSEGLLAGSAVLGLLYLGGIFVTTILANRWALDPRTE